MMSRNLLLRILGTMAIGLLSAGFFGPEENLQDVPVQTTQISGDQLDSRGISNVEDVVNQLPQSSRRLSDFANIQPKFEDEEEGEVEEGPVEYVRVSDAFGAGFYYIPGTETTLKIGGYTNPFNNQVRINYDSNICQLYNSGSFFYPNYERFDPRMLDEAQSYIDQLTDDEYDDYMDWLDYWGPRPEAPVGSPLWKAVLIADWMTEEELDELYHYNEGHDCCYGDEYEGRIKLSIPGLFAQILENRPNPIIRTVRNTGLADLGYGTQERSRAYINLDDRSGSGSGFPTSGQGYINYDNPFLDYPKVTFGGGISQYNLNQFSQHLEQTGGGLVENEDGGYDLAVGYKFAMGLDRFKIYADYSYGLENNIRDGSVPTLQYNGFGDPFQNYIDDFLGRKKDDNYYFNPSMLKFATGYVGQPWMNLDPLAPGMVINDEDPQDQHEPSEWETIAPRIGLTYELGGGLSLRIPYGKYTYDQVPSESLRNTPTGEFYTNPTFAGIQFKIEEGVGQGDQSDVKPAKEALVKLGFPIPPAPIEGNPRIDVGASEDPVQGEVDPTTGKIDFGVGWKVGYGSDLGFGLRYDYVQDEDETVEDTYEEDIQGWTLDPRMVRLKMDMDGGMVQIDPPSQDLEALPDENTPTRSVMEDIEGDRAFNNRDQNSNLPNRTDIDWNAVRDLVGDYVDPNAQNFLNQVTAPSSGTSNVPDNSFSDPSGSGILRPTRGFGGSGENTLRSDSVHYYTPNISGFQFGVEYKPQVNIETTQTESENVYSTNPNVDLGNLRGYVRNSVLLDNVYVSSLFFPREETESVKTALDNTPGVDRHDKNAYRDKQTDDPYFKSKGTWGQDYDDQWAIKHVGFTDDAKSAWMAAGDNLTPIIVAVIDTGIDWNHADLSWDRIWRNEAEIPDNGIDDDNNGYVDDAVGWDFFYNTNLPWDEDGHGTFVAGIIAAQNDNQVGISGINPAAKIMVLKALDSFGHTRASYLIEAIKYAVDNGAKIINLSVGGDDLTYAEELAVKYAENRGVLIFAAAGNKAKDGKDFGFVPYENVVVVSSTNRDDEKSGFSNWGEGIDISAPGEDVLSLRARRTDLSMNIRFLEYELGTNYVGDDKRYYRAAGTSFATPIVAGVASLIWSKYPNLSHNEVRRMVLQTAKDIDVPGRDQKTGFGLVDAVAALQADPDFEIVADIFGVQVVQDSGVFVAVTGTASANQFGEAEVFIGAGENPSSWKSVGNKVKKPVTDGELARIPAGELQGTPLWIIRVVVTHKNGKQREERFVLNLG